MKTIITHNDAGLIGAIHTSNVPMASYLRGVTLKEGQSCIEVEGSTISSPLTSFVDVFSDPPLLKEKAKLDLSISKTTITSDGADTSVISNIPQGVFVTWPDGQRDEVTDGVVEFATTQPNTYALKFEGVKYLSEEVSIEAHV